MEARARVADRGPTGTANFRVGCAGWTIPRGYADHFPEEGTHLERYALVFPAVEINSSFYEEHKPATYERWARSVPAGFRFSVKLSREVTHIRRLANVRVALRRWLLGPAALGRRLGPLLVQLPPSLTFDSRRADSFFRTLRSLQKRAKGAVVCEPRHPSWFEEAAERLLVRHRVARVAADPARVPAAAEPGGWPKIVYYRLHGSPRMYYSGYSDELLAKLAAKLQPRGGSGAKAEVWCIFDNTAAGAATGDALKLLEKLRLR